MMETAVLNVDKELQDCITQLDVLQKKSLLEFIKSFVNNKESEPVTTKEYSSELKESEAKYQTGESTFPETGSSEASKWIGKPQSIEEYNREIDEAHARIDAGEFYTHEEAIAIINSWADAKA